LRTAGLLNIPSQQSSSAQSTSSAQASERKQADMSALDQPTIETVDAVFGDEGTFVKKAPALYRFPVKKTITLSVEMTTPDGKPTCRLYKLEKDGTSLEYYLGWSRAAKCSMRVTLTPGDYQLDLRPTTAGGTYTMKTKEVTGDSNDGFSQAKLLDATPKLSILEIDDTADWYRFSLSAKKTMTIELTNSDRLSCFVYPLGDVDLYGFTQPECNKVFEYPAGSYVVAVTRGDSKEEQDFSIRMK
jgi:hypothetical protein